MESTEVDSFDLPADCDPDHVVIYEQEDPHQPPYYAVPFDLVDTWEDGTDHYMEPHDFAVTERYRQAVYERTDVDTHHLKLRREFETYTIEEADPI
jgi:hypothetical protein